MSLLESFRVLPVDDVMLLESNELALERAPFSPEPSNERAHRFVGLALEAVPLGDRK